MAAVAEIVLQMDDSGVVTTLQRTEAGLKKMGSQGNVIMTGLEKDTTKTSRALRTMASSVGLGNTQFLGMARLGVPGILAAIALGAVALATKIETIGQAVTASGEWIQIFADRLRRFLHLGESAALLYESITREQKLLLPLLDKERELRQQAAKEGLQGYAELRVALAQQIENIDKLASEQKVIAYQEIQDAKKKQDALTAIEQAAERARGSARELTEKQRGTLHLKIEEEIRKAEAKTAVIGLSDLAALEEGARLLKEEIGLRRDLTKEAKELLQADVDRAAAREKTILVHKAEVEGNLAILQSQAEAAQGIERIRRELAVKLAEIDEQERLRGIGLQDLRVAAERDANNKIAELRRQMGEDTLRIEEEAALATLPPWQRTNAGIIIQAQQRQREIEEALRRTEISEEDAARRTAAVWQQANAQIHDQLVSTLEDFASGPMEFFKRRWKQMLWNMIADTILASGTLRSIFGSILGIPLGGGQGGGGGLGGGNAGGLIIKNLLGGGFGFAPGGGGFGGSNFLGGLGGLGFGFAASSAMGGLGQVGPTPPFSGGGTTLPSGGYKGQVSMLDRIFRHGIGRATPQQVGTLGIGGLMLGLGMGGTAGLALSSAGGFFTGYAIGGLRGGIIGGAAGLLAGLMAQNRMGHQRDRVVRDLDRAISIIENSYNVHQTDYNSAIANLEQLRMEAVARLRQLQGDGHRANDRVDAAERRINATEQERYTRGATEFGPAMFGGTDFTGGSVLSGRPSASLGTGSNVIPIASGGTWPGTGGLGSGITGGSPLGGITGGGGRRRFDAPPAAAEGAIVMNFYGFTDGESVKRAVTVMLPELQRQARQARREGAR